MKYLYLNQLNDLRNAELATQLFINFYSYIIALGAATLLENRLLYRSLLSRAVSIFNDTLRNPF